MKLPETEGKLLGQGRDVHVLDSVGAVYSVRRKFLKAAEINTNEQTVFFMHKSSVLTL